MSNKNKKEVLRFDCPECESRLQLEQDENDDVIVSVFSSKSGENEPKKSKGFLEVLFGGKE